MTRIYQINTIMALLGEANKQLAQMKNEIESPVNEKPNKRWANSHAVRKWSESVTAEDGDVFTKYFDVDLDQTRTRSYANMHLAKLMILSLQSDRAENELYDYLYTIQKPV